MNLSNINRTADRAAEHADRKSDGKARRSRRRVLFATIAQEALRRPLVHLCSPDDRKALVGAYVDALAVLASQELGGTEANSRFGRAQFRCERGPELGERLAWGGRADG